MRDTIFVSDNDEFHKFTICDAVSNGVAVIGLDELLITSFRMQLS